MIAGLVFRTTSGITTADTKTEKTVQDESVKKLSSKKGSLAQTSTSTATTVTDVSDVVNNVMPAIVQVTNMSMKEYRSFFD